MFYLGLPRKRLRRGACCHWLGAPAWKVWGYGLRYCWVLMCVK
ncbi:hypothetical protein SAMN05421541_11020 [Actinoplanes philippinensis]|uniref:Uncharacterized protein n=1 Tax=Actinoplanes philippinensis TaxID=35752 RepID=A0A1I2IID8_9ACTN|nr:hypothetical protein SAMN05421541_11020 [Actinoplanes philippinensis]